MSKNWLNDLVDASPMVRHIAWSGELEFQGASETDSAGRTVQFILRRQKEELASAHPFSSHTRRRRGHVGTTFEVSLAPLNDLPAGMVPLGVMQMMLLNWASGPKGDTAKFMLDFSHEKHPFLGCVRAAKDQPPSMWMAVFIETDDQSQVVDQNARAALEVATQPRKPKQQIKNSNLAAQFTKDPKFHAFALDMYGDSVSDAAEADQWMKRQLAVTSKAEFDRGGEPAERFEELREEFVQWQLDNYGPEESTR